MAASQTTSAAAGAAPAAEALPSTHEAVRFSALRWPAPVHAAQACPALARAWAGALACYWQAAFEAGALDPAQPLYVLDFAQDQGQLAWHMLGALDGALAAAGLALRPVYLACAAPEAQLQRHPCLAPFERAGRFDSALFDVRRGALHRQSAATALVRSANPVALLSLGYFGSLPAELAALHRGAWFDGLAMAAAAPPGPDMPLAYHWPALDRGALPPAAARMLEHYQARCCDVALTMPLEACALFDAVQRFADGRCLVLGAEHACVSDQQIRLGMLAPPPAWPAAGAPPLNLHALALHQRGAGAATWHQQLAAGGIALHAACSGLDGAPGEAAMAAICAELAASHPDDGRQLRSMARQAAAGADSGHLLALLRLSHGDPAVLREVFPFLREAMPALDESARRSWRRVLADIWTNYFPLPGEQFHCDAGVLAIQLGSWGLARACFRFGLEVYGQCAHTLYLLAFCEAATGDAPGAAALLQRALAIDPAHEGALGLQADVSARLARHAQPAPRRDGLLLEPVGPQHAAALAYQCRDPGIAALACLPVVDGIDTAAAWIAEQQADPLLKAFAAMHEDWGLVGCVSARCTGADGYFYFWIGTDFQDMGLGQRAAAMLFDALAADGVEQLFTSAFHDNRRSLHALDRLGFVPMQIRAAAPDHDMLFLQRGPGLPAAVLEERLCRQCRASDSPFQFIRAHA